MQHRSAMPMFSRWRRRLNGSDKSRNDRHSSGTVSRTECRVPAPVRRTDRWRARRPVDPRPEKHLRARLTPLRSRKVLDRRASRRGRVRTARRPTARSRFGRPRPSLRRSRGPRAHKPDPRAEQAAASRVAESRILSRQAAAAVFVAELWRYSVRSMGGSYVKLTRRFDIRSLD